MNKVVSVALLTERVWGAGPPARARARLHSYLSRLRQALAGADVELAGRGGRQAVQQTAAGRDWNDDALVVHSQSETFADVTEWSGGIWERLHHDWSDLSHVVLTTVDSNVWGGRSGHTYTFTKQADGTTVVHAEVVREGKNFKGRLLGLTLGLFGKKVLGGALAKRVAAIETRIRNS